jgi:hypothetical protein
VVGDSGVHESSRRDLSIFLADHEECGRGFDIQRREGTDGSIVRVVCGGCHKSLEYLATGDTQLPPAKPVSRSVSRRFLNRHRRPPPNQAPAHGEPGAQPSQPAQGTRLAGGNASGASSPAWRPSRWPPWLSTGLIAGLISGGLVLAVVGITSDGDKSTREPASPTEAATSLEPTVSSPPATTTTPRPRAGRTKPAGTRKAREISLDQRRLAERVSIGVPEHWLAGLNDGAVTVADRSGGSVVQVYYEQGVRPEAQLHRESREFLLQRHPGARVAATGRTRVDDRQANSVRVVYPGGTESAVVLVAGGYSYLILERLDKPTSPEIRRTTGAVLTSFRPV